MSQRMFLDVPQDVEAFAWFLGRVARPKGCTTLEAIHQYTHSNGSPRWWVARWRNPETGDKMPLPIRKVEGKGFECKRPDFPDGLPLYRLHKLRQYLGEVTYLVEGEKCADGLESVGLVATTWPGGAQGVGNADFRPLAGHKVVVWPDNDAPGLEAMEKALVAIRGLGAVALMLDVPALGLPPKGDCIDWLEAFAARHGKKEFQEVKNWPDLARSEIEDLPLVVERRLAA